MKTAKINVTASVYLAAGEFLNGKTLEEPQWLGSGTAEVELGKAEALERFGYADILSKNGEPYTWAACCSSDEHNHAE